MPEKRRKFDREFREGTVQSRSSPAEPIAQVARNLGVNEGTLGNWVALNRQALSGDSDRWEGWSHVRNTSRRYLNRPGESGDSPGRFTAVFDDPNLVSCAGLAPTLALADRAGLADLVTEHLCVRAAGGANARLKVPALVAGMVAGADSIDDMDLLRHGGMGRQFEGVQAPSTLGTFLRTFTFGHVRQLDAVAARFLTGLARNTRSCPAPSRSPTSTSTTRSRPPTGTPSKAPDTGTPGSRV